MSISQVVAEEEANRLEWESKTIVAKIDGHEYTIADLRKVFDKVCNQDDWKAPWAAYIPHQFVKVVSAAVEFFHADRPVVVGMEEIPTNGRVLMEGRGYMA